LCALNVHLGYNLEKVSRKESGQAFKIKMDNAVIEMKEALRRSFQMIWQRAVPYQKAKQRQRTHEIE